MLRSTRGLVRSQFLKNRSGWAAMRKITAPTLVLWGDEDKLVAADLAPFVAAAIPNARLLVLEHIGHVAMMEDPQTSARAELALLEDAAAEARTRDGAGLRANLNACPRACTITQCACGNLSAWRNGTTIGRNATHVTTSTSRRPRADRRRGDTRARCASFGGGGGPGIGDVGA